MARKQKKKGGRKMGAPSVVVTSRVRDLMPSLMNVGLAFMLLMMTGCTHQGVHINLPDDTWKINGPMVPNGVVPSPQEVAKDAYSAQKFIEQMAPNEVITIFGSARTKSDQASYINTRNFAYQWTKEMGNKYPILTGGGPGLMEAGNRGGQGSRW